MSNDNMAREDFLQALQSKVEPKHNVIEDVLVSWQVRSSVCRVLMESHFCRLKYDNKFDFFGGNLTNRWVQTRDVNTC